MIWILTALTVVVLVTAYLYVWPVTIGRYMISVELSSFHLHSHGVVMVANYLEYHFAICGIVYLNRKVIHNPHNIVSMSGYISRRDTDKRRIMGQGRF